MLKRKTFIGSWLKKLILVNKLAPNDGKQTMETKTNNGKTYVKRID